MAKIKQIKIKNFKAITNLEIDFNGCTAIVTGGNDRGKTSFLRGIADRIRFIRPDVMVRNGETAGNGEMTLDNGEKFIWEFDNNGKDKLVFVSSENVKTPVTVAFGKKYFPEMFDIDKFLNSTPKEQVQQLCKISGLDFVALEERYKTAYNERKARNEEAERYHVKYSKMIAVEKVDFVDMEQLKAEKETERERLNMLWELNKKHNNELREAWTTKEAEKSRHYYEICKSIDAEVSRHNQEQIAKANVLNDLNKGLNFFQSHGYKGVELVQFIENFKSTIQLLKDTASLYPEPPTKKPEPDFIVERPDDARLQELDALLLSASEQNVQAQKYVEYKALEAEVEQKKMEAARADFKVKEIEQERRDMVAKANFPKGISIDEEGILIDGLPLNNTQTSSSRKYIAALQIGAMVIGEIRTQYFDASYLDKFRLAEIQQWADANDLQLLIERPDFDGGEIRYEIIQNNNQ